MRRRANRSKAFTLVELLCVIAILVLLITLLAPTLTGARALAQRAACSNNYHQIGAGLLGFAAAHDGRGPGGAVMCRNFDRSTWSYRDSNTMYNSAGGDMGWKGMLDLEYFKRSTSMFPYGPPTSRAQLPLRKQQFGCPSAPVTGNNYCYREMMVGVDFGGGAWTSGDSNWEATWPMEGPYGLRVDPTPPLPVGHPEPNGWTPFWGPNATWSIYTLGFAAAHNGRGPGGGGLTNPGIPDWASSLTWCDSLNAEYYRAVVVPRGIWSTLFRPKGVLICPNAKVYGGRLYTCIYQWNGDATGGPNWGDPNFVSFEGPYGKLFPNGYFADSEWDMYCLGAVLSLFPNPSYQFLASEGERANDSCPGGDASSPNRINLGNSPDYPAWSADGGQSAFRHMLPTDPVLIQTQARASYLFIDGHVEGFVANDTGVNSPARYAFK